jgi:hypothetical protein
MKNPLGKGLKDLARPGDRGAVERIANRRAPTVTITLTHAQMDYLWVLVCEGRLALENPGRKTLDDDERALAEEAFAKCQAAARRANGLP